MTTASPEPFRTEEAFARRLDAADPLARFRDLFHLPLRPDARPSVYFCGHSLGLQPKAVRGLMNQELDEWARHGVEGHFQAGAPWYSYHELFRESGARLVGALPGEVVMMNSLTINLHLLMTSFYRPTAGRAGVLLDVPAFPSDFYAVESQVRLRGFDPAAHLLTLGPRPGESVVRAADVEAFLEERGREIALVLWSGVNYFTGQWYDLPRLTAAAHRHGCLVGLDLAHAAGNVELRLHDWGVDFAAWCSYKYLNSGPGAVAGCFIHDDHGRDVTLPRLAGWWGNDPASRFQALPQSAFVARAGADGWQVSNPPIFALVPLRASLALFGEAGMPALRAKSEQLTGYLHFLLDQLPAGRFEVITPREPAQRGCQLSVLVRERPRETLAALQRAGVVCDFREPNVIRVAPVPLYNTYHEVWQFAQVLAEVLS